MIDADPQPSLSSYFKLIKQADFGLTEVLFNPSTINHCISQTNYGDLIYSNDPDNQLQSWLVGKGDGRFRLSIALKHLKHNTTMSLSTPKVPEVIYKTLPS
jgi:chromosome partitioning related protein ParA